MCVVFVYKHACASAYLHLWVNVFVHVCVYVCACLSVCACVSLWYAKYKICIYGMYANEPKCVKCKNGNCFCLCVHMCDHVPFINLISLACMPIELKSAKCEFFFKIRNFRNIIDRGINFALWVAPV